MANGSTSQETDAARFAAIVSCSSDAIISKTLDGVVQTWNPAAEALFGWTADEIIGQPITRIVPEELLEEEAKILESIRQGRIVPRFGTRRVAKDGTIIPIAVTVSPVRDEAGHVIGASKIANDLREQAQLQTGLQQATDQFTALANNIPQLAWIANNEGWIYWYNQRWYDYTGTTHEDMEGWGWKAVHHPDHVDRVVKRIQRAWDTGEPWEDTFPLKRHDGVYRWFLSRANPLKDEDGKVLLWCGSNTDISDELSAKERIRMLMREVNHRSRNMLATIQAMLNRSSHDSVDDLKQSLQRRITALKSNQEILDGGDWNGARVTDVIENQVQHVGTKQLARINITGSENLTIAAQHAEALGLAIHELTTNADKYGALSNESGVINITWDQIRDRKGDSFLEIGWTETGGPEVSLPTRAGFGSLLIKQNVESVFQGKVELDYRPEGLNWRLTCPADRCLIDQVVRVDTEDYM